MKSASIPDERDLTSSLSVSVSEKPPALKLESISGKLDTCCMCVGTDIDSGVRVAGARPFEKAAAVEHGHDDGAGPP